MLCHPGSTLFLVDETEERMPIWWRMSMTMLMPETAGEISMRRIRS